MWSREIKLDYLFRISAFQLDFEIFRTIASFIKISSGHSLLIKLIFRKFFWTIWEIGGQMFFFFLIDELWFRKQLSTCLFVWTPNYNSWWANVLRPVPSWITGIFKLFFRAGKSKRHELKDRPGYQSINAQLLFSWGIISYSYIAFVSCNPTCTWSLQSNLNI